MPNKLFAQNLQKKIQNRKMIITIEFYIFEIGIKFQCKLKMFNFWTKLIQKRYFRSKKEKKGKSPSNSTYLN